METEGEGEIETEMERLTIMIMAVSMMVMASEMKSDVEIVIRREGRVMIVRRNISHSLREMKSV